MGRFCSDSAAIRKWKFGPWGFFALTRVAPIHRASFCIQPYLNGFKRFFCAMFSSWAIETVLTWRSTIYFIDIFDNWPSRAWCIFDIKITGTESTKPKLRDIDCYSIRTITLFTFSAAWIAFSPLSKKNCKIWRIFSLLVSIFDTSSNNTDSSNHKTVWEVFLVRNLIFLTPFGVTRSHL